MTRVATPANERDLLEVAHGVPASRLGAELAHWLMGREDPEATQKRQHSARGVAWRVDPDGMVFGTFRLPAVTGKRVTAAIDHWIETNTPRRGHASADAWSDRWPSMAQQRADALIALLTRGGSDFVTEVLVNVRADGATFDDGSPIPWADLERILPEAFVRALIHDAEGRPINASARRRHPSVRQRRVVMARDRRCCDCGSTEFLEFDHVPPFEQSGRTVVDELALRCRTCHRRRHRHVGDDPD